MSSSVLRNVIQPRQFPSSAAKMEGGDQGLADPCKVPEEMEAVLGVLIENAPVAMAMFDDQMRYMLANRAWVEEFSLQAAQPLMGRSQYEVFPGMHPGWKQVYDRALQGHVVRSEHDALSGPDGRRVIYRWEVRPWRRKQDASVGGLMVTCEKFGNAAALQSLPAEEGTVSEAPAAATAASNLASELNLSPLPMVLLDERAVIHQANPAAVELGLARGIQEGFSAFWDVFAESRESGRVQLQWGLTLEKLAGDHKHEGWILDVPALQAQSFSDASRLPSQRWLVTHTVSTQEGEKRYLAMRLPASAAAPSPFSAAERGGASGGGAPDLASLATAVASISQATPGVSETATRMLEMRRLQDELARARQELRTLHEAERVFTQKEARVRQYLDALPCGVLVLDEHGMPMGQNEPLTRLLGRGLQKDETVETWLAAACPNGDHREEVMTMWREDVWRRQLTRTFSLATADGLLKELEFQPASLPGGGLLVCIQDVTEPCRQEEQLRSTEAKFRTLLHEVPLPVVLMDKAGAVFEVNHLAETLLGHPKTELRRYPLDAWLEPEDASARRAALRQLLETGGRSAVVEVRVRQASQSSVPVSLIMAPVMDAQGQPHCTIFLFQKKTPAAVSGSMAFAPREMAPQMAIPTSAAFFAPPMDAAAYGGAAGGSVRRSLLKTNVNGRIREITPRGLELLGLTEIEARGRALHLHFSPSDPSGFYAQLKRLAESVEGEADLACFNRDGQRQAVRLKVTPLDGGGFDFHVQEVAMVGLPNVQAAATPQVPQTVVQIQPTVSWPVADLSREKLLLSETHHRIKNHLQIISSLLNLESNTVANPDALSALRSSQNRVRAIAELHQHLYQIALGAAESFKAFAEGLVRRLRDCYQVSTDQVAVQLFLEEGEIQQEWLMPLALTLNETLSNSFEHAFPGGRPGHIQVRLSFGSQGGQLIVEDDGVGLPAGFEAGASAGLGLKILAVFAEQMRGQFSVGSSNSGGTEIQLRFPIAYADI
ncbi:PAS domain S-box-containing protein [Prosthecobacter debontii]|uniref:PAS domain S-box-containing protein n=1 Tax=Prosthecobacter debontii TaxID=48467 RepID=A0A1T4WTY0_9BACT|nr:PAS domain-containing protein [Prosthecobacter debontii]SKA80318.1 PAS domain S-box-containing protein [Prosthecobacter debontii]